MSTRLTRAATQKTKQSPTNQITLFTAFNAPTPTNTTQEFTRQDPPPSAARPKTSGIWKHVVDLDKDGKAPFSKTVGKEHKRIFICKPCRASGRKPDTIYECSGGTGAFRTHLRKEHRIHVPTTTEAAMERHTAEIESARGEGLWNDNIRAKRKRSDTESKVEPIQLRYLLLNWVAHDNLPFSLVQSQPFRAFVKYINPYANELMPLSPDVIRKDLSTTIQLRLAPIVKAIAKAQSTIHLIYDGWTSNNRMALFGIQARFLDEHYQLQTILLGLPKIKGEHTGVQFAELAFLITEKYEFTRHLGFTVADNADNNDTMVDEMELQMQANGYDWDAKTHRLRCLGHIIHLAAGDFFFKKTPDPHNEAAWRVFGCYGKLHNIVLWVQKSPQRMERFKGISHYRLIRDNSTRWHSYYDMCARAILLRNEITHLLNNEPELEKDYLGPTDWAHLIDITKFLKPFRSATKANEGLLDTIDRVLPGMEYLMGHLEEARAEYAANNYMGERVQRAWEKLDKYYKITDATIAYIGATVLNPMRKWHWFNRRWTTPILARALNQAKADLRQLWESKYAGAYHAPVVRPRTPQDTDAGGDGFTSFLYRTALDDEDDEPEVIDELTAYLQEPRIKPPNKDYAGEFRALTWWIQGEQQRRYPKLSKMAFDLLTVPAMSAEIERVFSECSLALNTQRLKISQETLEHLMCLRSWRRQEKKVSFKSP